MATCTEHGVPTGPAVPTQPTPTTKLASLRIASPPDSLNVGTTDTLVVSALNATSQAVDLPQVSWTSSSSEVATVTPAGVVTAIARGESVIKVSSGDVSAEVTVIVRLWPTALKLSLANNSVEIGARFTITATVLDALNRPIASPPTLKWSSDNSGVVRVFGIGSPLTVNISAEGLGSTAIRAQSGSVFADINISVVEGAIAAAILPSGEFGDTIEVAPGQNLQLFAFQYRLPRRLVTAVAPPVWTSSDQNVATVTGSGLVRGIELGTTTITVDMDGALARRTIRVAGASGSVQIRLVNATTTSDPVVLRSNAGPPVTLAFGQAFQQTVVTGTYQTFVEGSAITSLEFDPASLEVQQYTGYLKAGTRATFVAVGNGGYTNFGQVTFAPLWDWNGPIAADSVAVRVLFSASGGVYGAGYNVFLTPPEGPTDAAYLTGCYLDWPFGMTPYQMRPLGAFDIVLEAAKFRTHGAEAGRFHITPPPGHAVTYILLGTSPSTLRVLPLVDQ
jgi:uncharacterized protein YjdB